MKVGCFSFLMGGGKLVKGSLHTIPQEAKRLSWATHLAGFRLSRRLSSSCRRLPRTELEVLLRSTSVTILIIAESCAMAGSTRMEDNQGHNPRAKNWHIPRVPLFSAASFRNSIVHLQSQASYVGA